MSQRQVNRFFSRFHSFRSNLVGDITVWRILCFRDIYLINDYLAILICIIKFIALCTLSFIC